MSAEIRITAAIPCPDDQREQGRMMTRLDDAAATFEAAIKAATGQDVKIDMRAVRHKAPTVKTNGTAPQPEHVSSSDAGDG